VGVEQLADERRGVVGHGAVGEAGIVLGEPGKEQRDVSFVDPQIVGQVRGRRHARGR
jgi:hypothetical protein